MKKEKSSKSEIIRSIIEEYDPKTINEIYEALKDLLGETMNDMLEAELESELGYEKHDQKAKSTTNRRNGSYPKTVRSTHGEVTLSIPRDREGEYEPQLVPKGERDISKIEEKVLTMYAKGLSDRDISSTIDELYGFSMSHETISKITDKIIPRVSEWQSRELERCYPFVYIDALYVKVKSEGRSVKKAVYAMIGIDENGMKDVLGFWISETESAKFWLKIFDELKIRGVKKILFLSSDGLSGIEETVSVAFPETVFMRCMVHLVRNSLKYVPSKHYKEFCADMRAIYSAVSLDAARLALTNLSKKWNDSYPGAVSVWSDNFAHVERLFDYPADIRKMIYTTNMIEGLNSALRKVTDRKAALPNDTAVFKLLFLRVSDVTKKWTVPVSNWSLIRGYLDILFGYNWHS